MPDLFLLASWVIVLGAIIIGWQAGDSHDRYVIRGIAALSILSGAAFWALSPAQALYANVLADTLLLIWVARYALYGRRYWPVWFAGFQAALVFFELSVIFLPDHLKMAVWRVGSFWFIPAYFALALGTICDQRSSRLPN